MNWLMYIGGGLLFCKTIVSIVSFLENDFQPELDTPSYWWATFVAVISVWIWICFKFIK